MNEYVKRHPIDLCLLIALFVLAIAFRVYKINTPLIEYHSWRQADTMAVARNYAREGIHLLLPRYDDISPLQTGFDNPNGYRMVEFPMYNSLITIAYLAVPIFPIEIWGRVMSVLLSLVILSVVYYLAKQEAGRLAAFSAGLLFAIYPFFVFYTRAILPEILAIAFVMVALLTVYKKLSFIRIIIALLCFALSILVKPTTVFFGLALWYLLVRSGPFHIRTYITKGLLVMFCLLPFLIWRYYISHFPEGIPASEWLFTHTNTTEGLQNIFFKPAFFRWIFFERLNILILGSFSFVLFLNGIITKTKTHLPVMLLTSSLLYVFTFQGGNVQHEYYQILILPAVSIYYGLGIEFLYKHATHWIRKGLTLALALMLFAFGWFISWDKVHHYYYSLSDIPQFAKIVQTFVNPTDTIVVDTAGDTTALYAFDRKGSPGIYSDTFVMREKGYDYLFTYNQETADNLEKADFQLKRVFENNKFVLFKL